MEDRGRRGGPTTLGAIVRARRIELGWSQEELAERASSLDDALRQSDVSRLERGRVGLPRRDRLDRIAAALGLPLGVLLARSGWAGAEAGFSAQPPAQPVSGGLMVVDDEPLAAEALAAVLAAEGHRVRVAGDVAGALALAIDAPPRLVVADADLPDRGAVALAGGLRGLPRPVPLVLAGRVPEAAGLAGVPSVPRPLRLPDLLATMDAVLAAAPAPPRGGRARGDS